MDKYIFEETENVPDTQITTYTQVEENLVLISSESVSTLKNNQ